MSLLPTLATLAALAVAATEPVPAPPAPAVAAARSQVEAVLAASAAAWSRGDIEAFCAGYAEDAVFVSPSGITHGRDEVLARYRKRYPDRAAMGTLRLEPLAFAWLGRDEDGTPTGVSVVATWHLTGPDREPASGSTVIVMERRGELWTIVHDASM